MRTLILVALLVVLVSGCAGFKNPFACKPGWEPTAEDWNRANGVIGNTAWPESVDANKKDSQEK